MTALYDSIVELRKISGDSSIGSAVAKTEASKPHLLNAAKCILELLDSDGDKSVGPEDFPKGMCMCCQGLCCMFRGVTITLY